MLDNGGKRLSFMRRCQRRPVSITARLRLPGGPTEPVRIIDLGEEGCCIECWGMPFNPGDEVLVRPDGLEQLSGEVRWTKGQRMGLQFVRKLYGPVVDHLSHQFRQTAPVLSSGQRAEFRRVA